MDHSKKAAAVVADVCNDLGGNHNKAKSNLQCALGPLSMSHEGRRAVNGLQLHLQVLFTGDRMSGYIASPLPSLLPPKTCLPQPARHLSYRFSNPEYAAQASMPSRSSSP